VAVAGKGTRLFLGVDGGGTKTRARVRDEAGRALGEAEAGPGNFHLGEPAWREVMRASTAALAAAGIAEREFGRVHAGFGLAGTQPAADRAAALAKPHPFASLAVDIDAWAAYLGAWGGADGAILILGTGSCGLGRVGGRRFRIGGWGHDVGDDGSGMAMGRMAVHRALLALEGMAPKTPLAEAILGKFGNDPDRLVAWAAKAIPADYAAFAPAVFDHAGRGDALARSIVDDTVRGAVMHIDRLLELGAPKIAMIGGVFPPLLRWLPDRVRPFLVQPAADAVDGAILMARENAGALNSQA
jgi:glucosamine kinase